MANSIPHTAAMDGGRFAALAEADRTRANTWHAVNAALDRAARLRIEAAAAAPAVEVPAGLAALEREWDFDRVLCAEAATMGLLALAIGVSVDRRMLALAAVVSSMVALHGTQGWYPLLPLFRRVGVRTRDEIERERYALKALRGDFAHVEVESDDSTQRAAAAWKAVCA